LHAKICMATNSISKFGFYSAVAAGCASIAFTIVQLLQVLSITTYPIDAILINTTSLCIAPPFLLAMLALHYTISTVNRFYTHAAVLFATAYNVFVMYIYVVQLGAVLPYNITNPVLIVTPHSLFWTVDALGYINMGVAALFAFAAFTYENLGKWPKLWFLLHALVTPVIALVYFYPTFSTPLLMLGSVWSITSVASMFSLALWFKKSTAVMA